MSINFILYHCKSCSEPLFRNEDTTVDVSNQYYLFNNSVLPLRHNSVWNIPIINNTVRCYNCHRYLGKKINNNILKIKRDNLIRLRVSGNPRTRTNNRESSME